MLTGSGDVDGGLRLRQERHRRQGAAGGDPQAAAVPERAAVQPHGDVHVVSVICHL